MDEPGTMWRQGGADAAGALAMEIVGGGIWRCGLAGEGEVERGTRAGREWSGEPGALPGRKLSERGDGDTRVVIKAIGRPRSEGSMVDGANQPPSAL
jgi:hypothetical protein